MKVYVITGEPFPNGMAATSRIKCYAKALLSQNVECEVLVVRKTESFNNPRNTKGDGIYEGVPYKYIMGSPVPSENILIRQIESRTYKFKTQLYLEKILNEDDVILDFLGPQTKFVEKLIRITHKKGASYCRDLCELPAGTGAETNEAIKRRKYILEKIFPKLDGVIAISETLFELANQYVSKKCVVIKMPILVDFIRYELKDNSNETDIPYIFHAGSLSEQKDGFLGMITAFGIAIQKSGLNIRFVSTGNLEKATNADEISKIIEQYNIKDKIQFKGFISETDLKQYLSSASLVIINKHITQQNKYCFSTKIGEYLAAGKPIIITRYGEAMNWLKDGETAYIVEPNDEQQLANAIIRAFENNEERKHIGIKGKELCKIAFDYHNAGKPMLKMINQMKNSK